MTDDLAKFFQQMMEQGQTMAKAFTSGLEGIDVKAFEKMFPAMPKEMLPLVTKPLIQYGVEEALAAGITGMAIVTGRGKRAIEDHFDISFELEHQIAGSDKESLLDGTRELINRCTFSYTRQNEMLGLGHAILVGETLIGNEPFAVLLADDYCLTEGDSVLAQMTALYAQHRCCIVAMPRVYCVRLF